MRNRSVFLGYNDIKKKLWVARPRLRLDDAKSGSFQTISSLSLRSQPMFIEGIRLVNSRCPALANAAVNGLADGLATGSAFTSKNPKAATAATSRNRASHDKKFLRI
ncbi:hypothetical protein HZH68_011490 [Vespula germanica]|uniref:Uncharacterized protein n=2 Tax=Vespula TaxID=7451 RepID=A0A834JRB4_VESGE|nr:hypothetical protein HZH66_010171 [Vespula vulgaris]KAF7391947.1 hypothetical protein HZH68_011490 [Vespula germanica]